MEQVWKEKLAQEDFTQRQAGKIDPAQQLHLWCKEKGLKKERQKKRKKNTLPGS